MKRILALCLLLAALFSFQPELHAQAPDADKSILDHSYYPPRAAFRNFTQMQGQEGVGEPIARITYSRPAVNGRTIFGDLVKMDEVWRLGANESTELMVYQAMSLGGTAIEPGRYSLYAIPGADKWTLIVNSQLDSWGAYAYSSDNDVARIEVDASSKESSTELFSMFFTNDGHLNIEWDTTVVKVSVE